MRASYVFLLVAICFLTFFQGIGRPAIMDSDEAFYAEAGREMVESGDWTTPHYNQEYRFEKPVLYYWLVAVGYQTTGVNELSARLPSAIAGLILTLITFACGSRFYNHATGLLAGVIVATSFGYAAAARQALPDLLLACFITLGVWASLNGLVIPRPPGADPIRRWWLCVAGVALAGGFLTKGPVAVLLPGLVVGPFVVKRYLSARNSGPHKASSVLTRLVLDLVFVTALSFLLVVPWFAAMTATHGLSYLDRFFVTENLQRFVTDRYNAPRPFWYYIPVIIGGLTPWSPLMLLWLRPIRRLIQGVQRVQSAEAWVVIWALVPLVFYSASIGKQPRYILPVLPPLAILLARAFLMRFQEASSNAGLDSRDRLLAVVGVVSGGSGLLLGFLLYRASNLLFDVSPEVIVTGVVLLTCSGLGVIVVAVSKKQRLLPAVIVISSIVTILTAQYIVLSRSGPEPVEEIAALLRSSAPKSVPYGRHRVFVRNLLFYAGRPHVALSSREQARTFLESRERVLCVLTEADFRILEETGVTIYELGRTRYLNTGNLTLRTLMFPDSEENLETVVLVTNLLPDGNSEPLNSEGAHHDESG